MNWKPKKQFKRSMNVRGFFEKIYKIAKILDSQKRDNCNKQNQKWTGDVTTDTTKIWQSEITLSIYMPQK